MFTPLKGTFSADGITPTGVAELKPGEAMNADAFKALTTNGSITLQSSLVMAYGCEISYQAPSAGLPGSQGFGVGVCPPASLPANFVGLSGYTDPANDNYGNYTYTGNGASTSYMCWIPKFYYRWGQPGTALYAIYGANALEIVPASTFASTADANTAGYVLHRAFIDGNAEKDGFFVDKYQWSAGGTSSNVAVSVKNGNPLSSSSVHNPFSAITYSGTSPANNYGGAFAVAKSRGANFFPCSIFQRRALAYISLAHGQACKAINSSTYCLWADLNDISTAKNYPKGNNNSNLAAADVDDLSGVTYTTDGYSTNASGKTGSGTPFAKTTHNGQNCGVADVNGNMWDITPGITSDGTNFYILNEAVYMKNLTSDGTTANDAFNAAGIAANYTSVGATIGTGASNYFGSGTAAIFTSADKLGNNRALMSAGIPLVTSAVGVQFMGRDYLYYAKPNELCPLSGGAWSFGANAGVWALSLFAARGSSSNDVGGRSGFYIP